jgi:hypothetical protein
MTQTITKSRAKFLADDLAAAVRGEHDVEHLFGPIAVNEEAAGTKLAVGKSFIAPLGRLDIAVCEGSRWSLSAMWALLWGTVSMKKLYG